MNFFQPIFASKDSRSTSSHQSKVACIRHPYWRLVAENGSFFALITITLAHYIALMFYGIGPRMFYFFP